MAQIIGQRRRIVRRSGADFGILAQGWAARRNIRVETVRGPNEATRQIREEVYLHEKGYLSADTIFDAYDDRALILNAFVDDEPVGTMRLTDSRDGPLELLAMHPELEALTPRSPHCVEFSRLMVTRRLRGAGGALPLFREAILSDAGRADAFLLGAAAGLAKHYERLFGFRQISTRPLPGRPPGEVHYPMFVERSTALRRLTSPFWLLASLGGLCLRRVVQNRRRPRPRFLSNP